MPTARELLEQADALMRRNRVDLADDIPVLTDAVPSLAEAPARALAAASAAMPAQSHTGVPGVPGVPPLPAQASAHEGEPSDWLELEDAEPSIIGDAPDSVAIVPQVVVPRAVDEELLQSAEHEEIELTSAGDDAFAPDGGPADAALPAAVGESATWSGVDAPLPAGLPAADEVRVADTFDDARSMENLEVGEFVENAPTSYLPEPMSPISAGGPSFAATPPESSHFAAAIPSAAVLAASFAAARPAAGAEDPVSLGPDTRWPSMPVSEAESALAEENRTAGTVQTVPPLGPDDQAHWDSVAEEIRMQVLQRIDLFTDTGLREQLGERLKPIVDRASADLVATINQHVGELLRAYVAEAIEREIERWRQDN